MFKAYGEGGGSRTSRLLLLNPGTSTVSWQRDLLGRRQRLSRIRPTRSNTFSLAAHELKSLDLGTLAFLPAGKVYSAVVSGGPVAISEETVFNGSAYPAATFSLPALTASSFQVPGVLRNASVYSVVSLQNAGAQPASLTLAYVRADGTVGMSLPDATLAVGQTLRLDAFASTGLGVGFEGSLSVSSLSAAVHRIPG